MTATTEAPGMDVTIAAVSGCFRIEISGKLDETAPEIVRAAAAVASSERVPLIVETSGAYPKRSPILDELRAILDDTDPDPPVARP